MGKGLLIIQYKCNKNNKKFFLNIQSWCCANIFIVQAFAQLSSVSRDISCHIWTPIIVRYSSRELNVERRYSRGSQQSLLVVTPLFAAAEMRRQMTAAGRGGSGEFASAPDSEPFVAEFLSDVQLSLRLNSLNGTRGANASVCYFRGGRKGGNSLSRFTFPLKSTGVCAKHRGSTFAQEIGWGGGDCYPRFSLAGTITLVFVSPNFPASFVGFASKRAENVRI